MINEKKWGRVWEAREVFDLLDEIERELATPGAASDRSARFRAGSRVPGNESHGLRP